MLRSYVALNGLKPLGEKLSGLGNVGLSDPIGSLGVLADYVARARVRPDKITQARTTSSQRHADSVAEQVRRLRSTSEKLLREHRKEIVDQGLHHRRLSDALADIYAQIAVISRVTALFDEQGVEASGQERHIARDVLQARRAPRARAARPDREQRRRAHARRSPGSPTSAASYGYALCGD